jgi:nascent polypeptide-associated complex subunit alpha
MFPGGINPKQMGRMMKQMGIKNDELDAKEVIITLSDGKKIVFDAPSVQMIEMQGQKTYTISGSQREETSVPEDDIKLVAEQASVSEEEAKEALEETNGDIAEAISKLNEK